MIEVLFEDNHLLILNKPAGLLTEPSGTLQKSLQEEAKLYLKEKYQKSGNVYLGIVHRLDKPASGIVLFAKTSKALSRLNQCMRDKKFKKIYLALVEKKPPLEEMHLENYLIHDEFHATISSKNHPAAKLSSLKFRTLKKIKSGALLEVLLETGRYHQIRAQLSHIGCPIMGDQKYGSQTPFILAPFILGGTIALHHTRLEFSHPVTGMTIQVESLPPSYYNI